MIQDFYRNELLNFQEIVFETEFDFCLSSEQFDCKTRFKKSDSMIHQSYPYTVCLYTLYIKGTYIEGPLG